LTESSYFVAAFARSRKSKKKMKILNYKAYGNKSMKRTQLYQIIKEVKVGKTAD
jgi:hypothetical protein